MSILNDTYRWVRNLRSGNFEQGQATLYDNCTSEFCCLGVLAVSCDVPLIELIGYGLLTSLQGSDESFEAIKRALYVLDNIIVEQETLVEYNDSLQLTFNQIADKIMEAI